MTEKRLIVCCDGSWNDADSAEEFTNVVRLARAIKADAEVPQIVYYHSGVGTGGDTFSQLAGGAAGLGLSRNVRDAYAFLVNNYTEGDEVFLFGFSRGAYTARSVAGLIGWCGLVKKGDMDDFALLWEGYRSRGKDHSFDPRDEFAERCDPVPIKCIGVWDTVGALGIPGHLDDTFTKFYEFHDTDLGVHVENAFHALALDERRPDFTPTLWNQPANAPTNQRLVQMWFPGAHGDVGGGYAEHGLSDISLAWMASEVSKFLDLDADYLGSRQDRRALWGHGPIHDPAAGLFRIRGTLDRHALTQGNRGEVVHQSARVRLDAGAQLGAYFAPALPNPLEAQNIAELSVFERELRWQAAEPMRSGRSQKPAPNWFDRVLRNFGGG